MCILINFLILATSSDIDCENGPQIRYGCKQSLFGVPSTYRENANPKTSQKRRGILRKNAKTEEGPVQSRNVVGTSETSREDQKRVRPFNGGSFREKISSQGL